MNLSFHTIGTSCEFIKNELNGLYPEKEIRSLNDLILFHVLGIPKHEIHLEKGKTIDYIQNLQIAEIVKDIKLHKPIQYIFGYTDFFGLRINLSPDVLIPRPETEELVKWIIDDHKGKSPEILDIGTGSGCIAISLKKNLSQSRIFASDVSDAALTVAKGNAELHKLEIDFFHQDVFDYTPARHKKKLNVLYARGNRKQHKHQLYDIIVSNPPYIPLKEKPSISWNITEFEPEDALFVPDEDPLIFYRNISNFALVHLKNSGFMYFEIHEKSGHKVCSLLEKFGYRDIILRRDINGKNRMIRCSK